jgi:hypothetical protein
MTPGARLKMNLPPPALATNPAAKQTGEDKRWAELDELD